MSIREIDQLPAGAIKIAQVTIHLCKLVDVFENMPLDLLAAAFSVLMKNKDKDEIESAVVSLMMIVRCMAKSKPDIDLRGLSDLVKALVSVEKIEIEELLKSERR